MRSKFLFFANMVSTIYASYLIWFFGGAIIKAGGMEYVKYFYQSFRTIFDLGGYSSVSSNVIYAIVILLVVHICIFTLGTIFGWIGYLAKKSGWAKFAATLYLIGSICFPIYIFFALPITIIGFVGAGKQKKLNLLIS